MSADPLPTIDPPAPPARELDAFFSESWPETRLVSAGFVLLLALALGLPIAVRSLSTAVVLTLVVPVSISALATRHAFTSRDLRTTGRLSWKVLAATLPPAALAGGAVALTAWVAGLDVTPLGGLLSTALAALVLFGAAGARAVEVRYRLNARRIYLVAGESQRRDVEREISRDGAMRLVGFSAVEPGRARPSSTTLARDIAAAQPTMIVLSREAATSEEVVSAAAEFHARGGRVRDLDGFYGHHFGKVPITELTPSWFLFDVAEIHRPRLYAACKRGVETIAAAVGLLLTAPVVIVAAVAVKLEDPSGPILFRQDRVGRSGQPFGMLKLRTMRAAGARAPAAWAGTEGARILRVGRILRRWRIDEAPQLVNVLFGQLSLVGPRPEQVEIVRRLEAEVEFYPARHHVRPGLTGWAQVNHGYGGSAQGTIEKLQFDFYYVRHQSLRLDLLIVMMTLRAILRGDSG